ncbi:MAG: GNAT family N-acetyltransferase [Rhizobiales bacterium]|nr:GNAT family N-acetyltransferase [Hyphomicrobiales bacterium]
MPVSYPVPNWRALRAEDLPALSRVAEIVHPGFPEDDAVFAERLALAPDWCLALASENLLMGYVLSHPWHDGAPPRLNSLIGALPSPPSAAYIHDLALLPETRGGGHGQTIVNRLISQAKSRGLAAMALVAVSGSVPFWERQGFRALPPDPILASYGPDARLMRLALAC